jgi:hypothetical protein
MKIKLTIELDVPGIDTWSDEELRQNVFDDYIHYATMSHMRDAADWCDISSAENSLPARQIWKHHKLWADLCAAASWTLEKVE